MNKMLIVRKRSKTTRPTDERLVLPFELRQKSRLRAALASGQEVGLFLEPGELLRGGDRLESEDGRIIEVVAQPEQVMQISAESPTELCRIAYHLGNRHVALQIGDGWLRITRDDVLKKMAEGLGAKVTEELAPFEPEAGAYDHHAPATHGGIIHQFDSHGDHG
ncbi:MAG TPA: urease accessory protein UreE [Burkholderiales bacterium]|nr:urease accessory protein UreE [Burkholderiales bacterium]